MLRPLQSIIKTRKAELESIYKDVAAGIPIISNIPTGLPSLDAAGVGLPGIVTLVCAHPGDGKTSLLKQLLIGAVRAGFRPQGHLFEDPEEYFADGFIAKELNVSSFKLRRGEALPPVAAIERLNAAERELDWTKDILINTEKTGYKEVIEYIYDTVEDDTGMAAIDYAQLFDAEMDEKSVERILSRLVDGLVKIAKEKKIAVYLFSQVKNEVEQRGRKHYDTCETAAMWKARKEGGDDVNLNPEPFWVEGYRPLSNDAQWSNAMYQKCKAILSWFRPGSWMRKHGNVDYPDNTAEAVNTKYNFGPNNYPIRLKWTGENTTISEFTAPKGRK